MAEQRPKLMSVILIMFLIHIVILLVFRGEASSGSPLELGIRSPQIIIVDASGGGDYTHIQWAIDNASHGYTVYVEAGTYYENVIIDKTISMVGAGRENTTIDGGLSGDVVQIMADRVNIMGFKIIHSGSLSYPYDDFGIKVNNSDHCRIENNICSDNHGGIYLENSHKNTITDNICYSNIQMGIELNYSTNNNISNNICSDNLWGIYHLGGSGNTIINNTCNSNQNEGISSRSSGNTVTNNTCNDNGDGIALWFGISNSINNNTCKRNKWYGIVARHISTNTITNNICSNNEGGIFLFYSINNIIDKNTCSSNEYGILIDTCGTNKVTYNICNSNEGGMSIYNAENNIITNNIYSNNVEGIVLTNSRENTIMNSICSNNKNGIILKTGSDSNIISNNHIVDNSGYGVEVESRKPKCNENLIFLNNYIGNNRGKNQAIDNGVNNAWNTSCTGNYWSDWTSPDSDNDGIVDQPYRINGTANTEDNFPLEEPFCIFVPVNEEGDVIIDTHKLIMFDCSSYGDYASIVNCSWTFYYNGTLITLYGPNPSFRFDNAGNYTITFMVTDEEGNVDEGVLNITVKPMEETNGREKDEKDSGVYVRKGTIIVVFLAPVIVIFVYVHRKKKGREVDESYLDETGEREGNG